MAGAPEGGHLPLGLLAASAPVGHPWEASPLPSSRLRPGTCRDLSPPLLQYHTHGTPVSLGEGQSGNKGVFVHWLLGGGSCARLRFPEPLGARESQRHGAPRAVLHNPSALGQGVAPQATAGSFGEGGVGGEASGDAWRALPPAERRWLGGWGEGRISAAGGGGGGGRGSLRRAEPRGAGRASRALWGCSCQSSSGWNSLPLFFNPPPCLDRPQRHARPPSLPSSRSPSPFLALSSRTILVDKL